MKEKSQKKSNKKDDNSTQLMAEDVKKVAFNEEIPEKLKIYVSPEIWSMWSPIRRESFTNIIKNPNTFFYRNRPPGDPQKTGPFTNQEEHLFIERVKYFREVLHIEDGLWGLFSVPIRGRLGYQCSNFYRQLIKDGKIKDDHYQIVDGKLNFKHGQRKPIDPSVIKLLEKEAFDFIEQCLASESGDAPQMVKPIRIAPPIKSKSNNDETNKQVTSTLANLEQIFGKSRKISERKYSPMDEMIASGGGKSPNKKKKRNFLDYDDSLNPLIGAIDPLTQLPIKTPMMDETGYVMDLTSWRKVFKQSCHPPFDIIATSESELVSITSRNYQDYRLQILNIPC